MEYSIQELSRLSGVTTRTLRWYDQIGLLKPARVAETGYRYYGPAEVDRLRDILYYRALGVELARIKECLDDPSFDRLTALPGGEYYVDMAVAWAFSVALVKHFEQTLPYFTQRRLDRRVHNKALQKGRESLRIDDARKTILQRLKY